jgi:hypothetical protein
MKLSLGVVLFAFLVACGNPTVGSAPAAQPSGSGEELQRIECTIAYRGNPTSPGREERLTVEAQRDGQIHKDSVRFRKMSAGIRYFDDGYESPVFNVIVRSKAEGDITAKAYQLGRVGDQGGPDSPGGAAKKPENEFVGGHGFTGLGYVFDQFSKAEIQYFCEAF